MTDHDVVPGDARDDGELWDIVAAIPVPPAQPDFALRLDARLATGVGSSGPTTSVGGIAAPASHKRRRIGYLVAAAVMVIAVSTVLVLAVLPEVTHNGTATAADVLASMSGAGGAQTIRLTIVKTERWGGAGAATEKRMEEHLTLSVTGDYRGSVWQAGDGPPSVPSAVRSEFGYDFARHQLRYGSPGQGDGLEVLHPAWPTDVPEFWSNYLAYKAMASSVRAMLAEMDPRTPVDETTYLGRPAWRAALPNSWGASLIVTVDKATGLLVESRESVQATGGQRLLRVLRVATLQTDPQLPADWQVLPLLHHPTRRLMWNYFDDRGTRFGSPGAVATRAWPTLPLFPRSVPAGYVRVALANAVYEDPRPEHGEDNSWHWASDIVRRPGRLPGLAFERRLALKRCAQGVLILYRRGFDTFTIEITPRLPHKPGMGKLDEMASVTKQDTVLTGGYLKGTRARTWVASAYLPIAHVWGDSMIVPFQGPTLLAYTDRSQIVIYGDLTRQELLDVADSLQVYGDVAKPLPADYGD
ncbi:MAG TPA: hypothetical protein VMH50_14415 [Thermoleophilia bacterium]|nr:hypothetical protein [Thermoleophilia bacterium]